MREKFEKEMIVKSRKQKLKSRKRKDKNKKFKNLTNN